MPLNAMAINKIPYCHNSFQKLCKYKLCMMKKKKNNANIIPLVELNL